MTSKKKKPRTYNMNSEVRGALRRAFSRSPIVREVKMARRREVPKYNKDGSLAKKPAVQYQCNVCGEWVSSTKVSVDHIVPVIPEDGTFTDWNTFIARLWCDISNLQNLCSDCHLQKSNTERAKRKQALKAKEGTNES